MGPAVRDQFEGTPVNPVWMLSDIEKLENQKQRKEKIGYDRRWIVEIAIKMIFGDCVMATKHVQGSDLQLVMQDTVKAWATQCLIEKCGEYATDYTRVNP